MLIAIADLGVGNLRSVEQAFKRVTESSNGQIAIQITSSADVIDRADKVVLPGQGAIGTWFKELDNRNLRSSIELARSEKPIFGICVGMQAMFEYCAEDGGFRGFGWYDGAVEHFTKFHNRDSQAKIPHMGWNTVKQYDHPMWHGVKDDSYFYFVHSYCANITNDSSSVRGITNYQHEFVAAIGDERVFATQFHPEKSHDDGLKLISNFVQWSGAL